MAPIIHCVRHAQGFHNLGVEFHSLPDPKLTPLGEEQCAKLRANSFPDQSHLNLITSSPLTRTLHTAFSTFEPALKNGHCKSEILALPDTQETSDYPCDTGSDVEKLQEICKEHKWPVNLDLVQKGWNVKTLENRYSPASDAIKARARDARTRIRQQARELMDHGVQDPQIVLVTHGGYLHYFTDDWEDAGKLNGTGWENTETRAYTFENDPTTDDDDHAWLVETEASRKKRGIVKPQLGHKEQEKYFQLCMQGWEDQGLQRPDRIGKGEKLGRMSRDEELDGVPEGVVKAEGGEKGQPDARGQEPAAKNMTQVGEKSQVNGAA